MINETHDSARRSWVGSANGHLEFSLQNLPFGVFSPTATRCPTRGRAAASRSATWGDAIKGALGSF
jgi:fumarylacetoacetase